jgi:polyhydroxybutyrate depolymerase
MKLFGRFNRIALILLGCWSSAATAQGDAILDDRRSLLVGEQIRTFYLTRHRADQPHGRLPIVIYLHGLGALASEELSPRYDLSFASASNMEPALILRPQGVNREWDISAAKVDTWRRPSGADGVIADDIGFLNAMITEMITLEQGDPNRVYVAGSSNGGYMAARVACEMNDRVTAVAILIATARSSQFHSCREGRPIPILLLASTTDPSNPYAGRVGDSLFALASAPKTAAFFADRNKCQTKIETPLPHSDAKQESSISLIRFTECLRDAEVLFYRIDGAGHSLPSRRARRPGDSWAQGGQNNDIEMVDEVWSFFRRHR